MGIKFRCHGCDKRLHVKAFLAGKRGVCPHCGAKVQIPLENEETPASATAQDGHHDRQRPDAKGAKATTPSAKPTSTASRATAKGSDAGTSPPAKPQTEPDALAEAPEAVWYVRPPSGGQFGPADADIMRRWLDEGRVSADSLVWREGWEDWKTGDTVFPALRPAALPVEPIPAAGVPEADANFAVADQDPASRHARKQSVAKANIRGVAIIAVLSVICLALLIALWVVLQNQGS